MPKQRSSKEERRAFRAHQADQRRPGGLRRYIVLGIIVVLVVALGLLGWSVYNFQFKPYNQTAVNYNGTALNMRYFINMLKIYYNNAPPDTTISTYADYVEQQIEQNETIIEGSKALGVTIAQSKIDDGLRAAGLPVDREHRDVALATSIMSQQVPSSQQQYRVDAVLTESPETAQAVKARLEAGDPIASVAANVTRYTGTDIINGDFGWVTPREVELDLGDTAFGSMLPGSANGTVGGPLYDANVTKQYGYWIAEAIELKPATANTSATGHLYGMLLGSQADAQSAIEQVKAGADFNELAKTMSLLPSAADNGADLGWVTFTGSSGEFQQLEDLPLNTIVGPVGDDTVQTPGGYWVYRIADTNPDRDLSNSQYNQLSQDWIDRCTAALKQNPDYKVENLLTQEMKDFALNEVVLDQGKGSVLIATETLPDAETGIPYSFQILTYGNEKGNTWSLQQGTLPKGLELNTSTGLLSGTPQLAGGSGFTVRVDSGLHYSDKELVLRIHIPPRIKTTDLPDATVNQTYQQTIDNIGDASTNTWSIVAGTLPDGLQLDESAGMIYGTPTAAGTYTFTIQVDDTKASDSRELTIVVQPAAPAP